MPKTKKTKTTTNIPYLNQLISSGKAIAGIPGFLRLKKDKNDIFVPVRISGITTGDEDNCSVQILAKLEGNCLGPDLPISPCQFYKDQEDIDARLAEEKKLRKANAIYARIRQSGTVSLAKSEMMKLYNDLEPAGKAIIDNEAKERGLDMSKSSTITGSSLIKSLARLVVQVSFGLTEQQASELSEYGSYYDD